VIYPDVLLKDLSRLPEQTGSGKLIKERAAVFSFFKFTRLKGHSDDLINDG
jgi:hypothetical protein